jgi:hypothetical protein
MRVVMVRQRGGGLEPVFMLVSQPNATWLGGMIAVADTREHRIQSGRSGILASNRPIARGSSAAARPTWGGRFRAGQSGGGWTAHEQTMRPSEGVVLRKKGLKRKRVEQRAPSL